MPEGTPLTFDTLAQTYLEHYVLQRYRTLNTARPRVEHLREFLGGWPVETITADAVRQYQLFRRKQGAAAATINRETSALSRMFQLAIRRGLLERMPLFPGRLEEIRRATGSSNMTSTYRSGPMRPRPIRTCSTSRTTRGGVGMRS